MEGLRTQVTHYLYPLIVPDPGTWLSSYCDKRVIKNNLKIISNSNAHLQTMIKTPVQFQKGRLKLMEELRTQVTHYRERWNIPEIFIWKFSFFGGKKSIYLNRHVFVLRCGTMHHEPRKIPCLLFFFFFFFFFLFFRKSGWQQKFSRHPNNVTWTQ